MRRTTVGLPDDLDARLRQEAYRRGTTLSAVAREAIEMLLDSPTLPRRLLAAGVGASGRHDISEGVEELLGWDTASLR